MVNRHRGEISAELGGKQRCLCLTLGALAQLESYFAVGDLSALAERFATGKLAAADLISIIHAGLLGGGHTFSREEVAEMQAEGGLHGYAKIAAELLTVTFGDNSATNT
ncbi:MAG: gene transfer agent family protein [Ahrensia sp.]|nr:gene transfer agent family protein [Ahrensia sp.]